MKSKNADVLLVEDDVADAELALRALHRQAPEITASVVNTGSAAIEYLQAHNPKVVLMDLRLPDIGGLEVLRWMRAEPRTSAFPVIILSGSPDDSRKSEVRALGVSGYINKTSDVNILAEHFSIFRYLICGEELSSNASVRSVEPPLSL